MSVDDQLAQGATPRDTSHVSRQVPFATIGVLVIVAIITGLQFVYPVVLETLRRDPAAFTSGQWWRLLSPLLVHADGPLAWVSNSIGIALVGPPVERMFGRWRWLLLFLVGGLAGNITGYAWDPYGAGTSVGMFGLIGGLFAWLLMRNEYVWPFTLAYATYIIFVLIGQTIGVSDLVSVLAAVLVGIGLNVDRLRGLVMRVVAIAGLLGALALTAFSNNHGPPIIAGACLAALLLWCDPGLGRNV